MIGGGTVTDDVRKYSVADTYCNDAVEAVNLSSFHPQMFFFAQSQRQPARLLVRRREKSARLQHQSMTIGKPQWYPKHEIKKNPKSGIRREGLRKDVELLSMEISDHQQAGGMRMAPLRGRSHLC